MRETLTGLAIAVIGALFLALVAPFFINFTHQRPWIETQLSRLLGTPVTLDGAINIRFLPTPVLDVETAYIGSESGGLLVSVDHLHIELSAMPLLKGEMHVLEARIEHPVVSVTLKADGSWPSLPQIPVVAGGDATQGALRASVERLNIRGGEIQWRDQAGEESLVIRGVDIDTQAGALIGPWRGEGQGEWAGSPVAVRFSTGAMDEAGALRLKLVLQSATHGLKADVDGQLSFGKSFGYDGKVSLSGLMNWPQLGGFERRAWAVLATAKMAGRAVDLPTLSVEAGGEEGGFKLLGSGTGTLGSSGGLALQLDARQLDLDRPLTPESGVSPAIGEVLTAWRGALMGDAGEATSTWPVDLSLGIESILAGGDSLKSLALQGRLDSKGVSLKRADVQLPGLAKLTASGSLATSDGGGFFGHMRLVSKEPTHLLGWIEAARSGRSNRIGDAKDLTMDADWALSPSVIAARNLKITVDQSTVSGLVRYTPPEGGERGHLDAQLVSDKLALEQIPDSSALVSRLQGTDVSIALDARNVQVLRNAGAHAGRVQMKASSSANGLVIDTLDIADLGGAALKASGRLTEAGDRVEASIDARDVAPLAALLKKVVPGVFPVLLADRAAAFSPLKLKLVAERANDAARTVRLTVDGTAAATKLAVQSRLSDIAADTDIDATIEGNTVNPVTLLRQFGLDVLPIGLEGQGRVKAHLKGLWSKALALSLQGNLGSATFSGDGQVEPLTGRVTGKVRTATPDAVPLLQVLALPVPDIASRLPLALVADAEMTGSSLRLTGLQGQVSGQPVTGALAIDTQAGKIEGKLSCDSVSLGALAALEIGPVPQASTGNIWSSVRFSPPVAPSFEARIALTAKSFDTGMAAVVKNAAMTVRWQADSLDLQNFVGSFAGGQLTGSLTLRRQNALASYLGKMALKGVAVAKLWPNAGVDGVLDLEVDGGGSGESLSAFVASLAGGGQARLDAVRVDKLDPRALPLVTAALDAERDPPDLSRVRDLFAVAFDRASFTAPSIAAPLTLSNGVARLGPIQTDSGATRLQGSLALDVKVLKFDGRMTVFSSDVPKDWAGPEPQTALQWKTVSGGAIMREIDVSMLTNVLTTRAVTRELARIEAFESDLRERNFFIRRLKSERDRLERDRKAAEEARLAEEAKKRAEAEEAARMADEARRQIEAEQAAQKAAEAAQKSEHQNLINDIQNFLSNTPELAPAAPEPLPGDDLPDPDTP